MNNPDLYILTMVNEFISTLYCVKYRKLLMVCLKYENMT